MMREEVRSALAEADEDSVKSPTALRYEEFVRHQMRRLLLYHCGLDIPEGVNDFHRQNLEGREWDFRAPVLVAPLPPAGSAAKAEDFVIFPSKPAYIRPPPLAARQVTPKKFGDAPAPPLAHYLSIFEITTKPDWTKPSRRQQGLLERLEIRLLKTYDRARATNPSVSTTTDIVAVVGVVAPSAYTESVRSAMEEEPSPFPKLREMMNAGRFVFIRVPLPGGGSPRGAGSSRGAASTTSAPSAAAASGGH